MTAIKKVQKTDIPLISELEKLCFGEPWSEKTLTYFFENGAYIAICSLENTQVGYAILDLASPDFAEIMRIATLPSHRGKGYSNTLMEALIKTAKESKKDKILLEVRQSNAPAIALYEKFGFKTDGVRKNYYHSPTENGILMSLDLNERQ